MQDSELPAHAATIVAAYVSHNAVPAAELPALIARVYESLECLARGVPDSVPEVVPEPAVPIKKSVTPDYVVCLEDGRKFKSMKRHLSHLGMTPAQYREKWQLPADYPMVCANYSAKRSGLAKANGLGRKNGSAA